MSVAVTLPQAIFDRYRPSEFSKHRVTVNVPLLGTSVALDFDAYLYECPLEHITYVYRHADENNPEVMMCPECGADSQGLTLEWRWGYHSDYTECRGCGDWWDFQKSKPSCRPKCPYELVGHAQTHGAMY